MTLIETDGRFVTLTTEKGKTIEVTLPWEQTPRFVRRQRFRPLLGRLLGRPFSPD